MICLLNSKFVIFFIFFTLHNYFTTLVSTIKTDRKISHQFEETFDMKPHKLTNNTLKSSKIYSKWSAWSRCVDCLQRRMKKCISPKCEDSRIYEERACEKKRCRRKARQKKKFHLIHLYEDSSFLTRQAPSKVWSKWSNWSPCSETCRTRRVRICRKPGRCRKKQQEQSAYCYHDNSRCEMYVLNLLDNQRYTYDIKYEQEQDQTRKRTPRRRIETKKCGRPFKTAKMLKIIGGAEARKYKWPWHAAIINKYKEVFCGGTVIAPRWVLTANHCIRPFLRVRLNEHDLNTNDGTELEMTIQKMYQHPRFNHKTVENDIALLLLPIAVRGPVACLPNRSPKPGEICSVMGWGKLSPTDTYGTSRLHETKLPIVDHEICENSYRHFLITINMLCAGWPSGKSDTCAGDSGGGLMCPFKPTVKSKLAYSVQGITSFGDGCGLRHKYGIYTTVFNYLKWIYYIMDHYS